ncbi:MAG TPA: DUF2147 domain-containing protein [Sphingobacteriaceae bacterium]
MKFTHKLTLLFVLVLTAFTNGYAFGDSGDRIIGVWLTASKNAKIQIYKSNDRYFGRIIWADDLYEADGKTLRHDSKNEDPSKRNRTIKGLVLLNSFNYKDGVWADGTIYDPQNGKTYKCKMELKNSDLHIRGYIGISMFGRTEVWQKLEK